MKIIKHLLSHIGLFVVVVLALVIIYFRVELFPDHINKPIDAAINDISNSTGIEIPSYQSQENDSTETVGVKATEISNGFQVHEEDVGSEIGTESESASNADMMATITESVTQTVDSLFSTNEDELNKEEKEAGGIVVNDEADSNSIKSIITETVKTVENSFDELVGVGDASSDMDLSDTRKILTRARNAFWRGDMEESEKAYRELTEHEELDPNAYGELGNVYYAQGKWKEAGKAYYEAAARLIDLKQTYQVNYLYRVIQGLDAESAKKLKQKMTG